MVSAAKLAPTTGFKPATYFRWLKDTGPQYCYVKANTVAPFSFPVRKGQGSACSPPEVAAEAATTAFFFLNSWTCILSAVQGVFCIPQGAL